MKISTKVGLIALVLATALAVAVPPIYSLAIKAQAKSHLVAGCEAFMADAGAKESENVLKFHREFSKAALKDPAYLPIAKASDWMGAEFSLAATNNFVAEWRDASASIQGLCWSVLK
jgi:hypothetical protein